MPPSFVLPKRSIVEVDYGKSINLTCQANGLPKPRVRWIEGVVTWFWFFLLFYFFCLNLLKCYVYFVNTNQNKNFESLIHL